MAESDAKEAIRAIYDERADESLDDIRHSDSARVPETNVAHYFIDRKIDQALAYCTQSSEANALEIGCSVGNMTVPLAQRFKSMTAVDLSPKSINLAREGLQRHGMDWVEFICDDAEELSKLEDETFDVVFSFSALRYCPSVDKAIASVYRVTKPGGEAIIDWPNRYSPWHWLIKRIVGIKAHVHDNLYTKKEIVKVFEDAGFKDVEAKVFLFTTRRFPDFMLPITKAADWVLERIPLVRNLAGIIMVHAKK